MHIAILETSTNITRQFSNQVLSFFWIYYLTNRTMILHSCCDLFVPRNEWTRESTRDAHLEMKDGDACSFTRRKSNCMNVFPTNSSNMHATWSITSKCARPHKFWTLLLGSKPATHVGPRPYFLVRWESNFGPANKLVRPAVHASVWAVSSFGRIHQDLSHQHPKAVDGFNK